MNFDLDDPLGSDDSFFEEPKALNKRGGLKQKPVISFEESLKQDTKASQENPARKKDDWLGDSDLTNMLDKKPKKTDFLDDILSGNPSAKAEKKGISFEDILKESKASAAAKSASQGKDIAAPAETKSSYSLLSTGSRETRRGRRGSGTGIEDTLGLFGDEFQSGDFYGRDAKSTGVSKQAKNVEPKVFGTTTDKSPGIPDWLGGSLSASAPKVEDPVPIRREPEGKKLVSEEQPKIVAVERRQETAPTVVVTNPSIEEATVAKQQQINTDLQTTYAALQQQESFLLLSMQLKKYEENLQDIKNQQKEIMEKQEQQFSTLLDKYIIKQQMIENNIKLQQERINSHMQMLISYPSEVQPKKSTSTLDDAAEDSKESTNDFEHIISSLKLRHNEEMFLMEESYKKQISLLEKSAESTEERLTNEIANASKTLEEKIQNIHARFEEDLTYHKQKIQVMEEQHNNEMKLVKEQHARVIEEMKMEHSTQIEYLKQLNKNETELLNSGNVYSKKLDTTIEMLQSSGEVLQGVQEKLVNNFDVLTVARENSIVSREKEIVLMRNALDKCRAAAENERSQLLALIRTLETKIAEQNSSSQEERWALQQASASLAARSEALNREADYSRNAMEREREQLKTLKESLLSEQENMILKLTEEKLQLSKDKARFETSTKLTNNYETEKLKAEAETAIQVAKELTQKVTEERDELYRRKHEMETLKRKIADREIELAEKERELNFSMQNTQLKISEEKRVIAEAKKMESMYKERLQELQSQWMSLTNREKKLAEEKVLLSRERLALYTTLKQTKSCVLCKTDENRPSFNESYLPNFPEDVFNSKVADADTLRFHLDIMEDEKNSEVSKEENDFVPNNEIIK